MLLLQLLLHAVCYVAASSLFTATTETVVTGADTLARKHDQNSLLHCTGCGGNSNICMLSSVHYYRAQQLRATFCQHACLCGCVRVCKLQQRPLTRGQDTSWSSSSTIKIRDVRRLNACSITSSNMQVYQGQLQCAVAAVNPSGCRCSSPFRPATVLLLLHVRGSGCRAHGSSGASCIGGSCRQHTTPQNKKKEDQINNVRQLRLPDNSRP
jgi:hypothetical protein